MKCQARGLLIWCNYSGIKSLFSFSSSSGFRPNQCRPSLRFQLPYQEKNDRNHLLCCANLVRALLAKLDSNSLIFHSRFKELQMAVSWWWGGPEHKAFLTRPWPLESCIQWFFGFWVKPQKCSNSWNFFSFSHVKATCLNAFLGGFPLIDHPNIRHNSG